jgi:mono/diheme cytochrome c family protein
MQPRKFNDGKRLASNVRHVRLLLVALWLSGLFTTLAIPMSRASAQGEADSADRAFDILSRRCFQCHGANGLAKKNIFVLDRERLLSSGVVAPGDPNSLLLKLVDRGEMPIFVMSRTVYLKPDQLEHELGNLPEFRDLKLMIVKDRRAADLKVELDRPVFTYTFTWTVTSEETSILVFTGKTIAFDGNFAAPKIAKDIIRRIKAARQDAASSSR